MKINFALNSGFNNTNLTKAKSHKYNNFTIPDKSYGINFCSNNKDAFTPTKTPNDPLYDYFLQNNHIVRKVSDNIYAGETLADKPNLFFERLARSGISTILDMRGQVDEKYQDKCLSHGIDYISISLNHVVDNDRTGFFNYATNTAQDDIVDNLSKLLEATRNGNLYLGCQYGVDRTNFALLCDYIFNYDTDHKAPIIYPSNYTTRNAVKNKNLDLIRAIIKKLSPEQREKLHLPDDFEEKILNQRIKDIINANKKEFPIKTAALIQKKTGYLIKL